MKTRFGKLLLFAVGCVVCNQALALDTIEPYALGLSDFEFYYTGSKGVNSISTNVGYGVGRYLNPAISIGQTDVDGKRMSTVSLLNVTSLYKGTIEFDVIPSVEFAEVPSFSLGFEWTLPLGSFTPYVQHTHRFQSSVETSGLEHSLSGGAMYSGFRNLEMFVQVSQRFGSEPQWGEAVGVNWKVTNSVELVASVAFETEANITLGSIYTLE